MRAIKWVIRSLPGTLNTEIHIKVRWLFRAPTCMMWVGGRMKTHAQLQLWPIAIVATTLRVLWTIRLDCVYMEHPSHTLSRVTRGAHDPYGSGGSYTHWKLTSLSLILSLSHLSLSHTHKSIYCGCPKWMGGWNRDLRMSVYQALS